MKKLFLLSIGVLSAIFILASFSGKKIPVVPKVVPVDDIIDCAPPSPAVLLTAATFKDRYGMEPLKIRKNVETLSQAELNAIKVGILKMRALPYTNPTSWIYQASIHGTTLPDNLPSWNMCHRAGESVYFLAWHRMYVYFFERILRAKSGRAELTLPYWDYQTSPSLPAAYRDKSPGNPLYDATRTASINNGGALPASIMTAFDNSLDIIPYYTFQSNLSGGPHGSVHTSLAGNMAVITTAAKDPAFWLHHSNIDRLWEKWRGMCNGRANPTEASWMNKTYTFFDETGTAVNIKGSDVIEIASQLNYRYDDRSPVISCPASRPVFTGRQSLIAKEAVVEINGQAQKAEFSRESPAELESFMRTSNRSNFNFGSRSSTTSERLVMTFEGVSIQQMPQGVMEVYLNLPAGSIPHSESNYFVGLLDLFSAEHHASHPGQWQTQDAIELDATKVAQALGLTLPALRNAVVSFYVRGISVNGVEVRTEAQVTVRRIRFAVDTYQN